jgi:UDP-GlcNAc:undecaprenyl-phosphate GlcNAc-1-phosphate transferase
MGLVVGSSIVWFFTIKSHLWLLFVCVAPAFVWGLIEDISKRGAVLPRLALPALAGALGFILLDARLTQLAIPGIDELLAIHALAFLITLFAVTGVTHAINVVDGLNGLASVTALLAAAGLAIVARIVGDDFVFAAASLLAASLIGFLLVNYPSGRIFLGDGGAYLVGLVLAELSVLLVHRNSEVSPWFPLMLLAYPIWETLFSMYRRKTRGYSTAHADALHLHQLVYRRLVRWRGFSLRPADKAQRNSLASLCMWPLPLTCFIAALLMWQDSLSLQMAAAAFVLLYCIVYRGFVHFRVPQWAIVRARPVSADIDGTDIAGAAGR